MTLTHDTTHAQEARALLCQQFKGNAAVEALLNGNSVAVQMVEDALWTLYTLRLPLSAATGVQLDGIGQIVGQNRNNLGDTDYRLWLSARLLANASCGGSETLLGILSTITNSANVLQLVATYPAALVIWIGGALAPTIDPVQLAAIMGGAVAGGVNLQMIYSLLDDAHTFTFADADAEQADTERGWIDEMVVNGNFNDWSAGVPVGWTLTGNFPPSREISQVGSGLGHGGGGLGACNFYATITSSMSATSTAIAAVIGKLYTLRAEVSYFSGNPLELTYTGSPSPLSITSVGTYTRTFVASFASIYVVLQKQIGVGALDITIDSVSVLSAEGGMSDVLEV